MEQGLQLLVLLIGVGVILPGILCHPERPAIPDDPIARMLFSKAEENRTQDGYLTAAEMEEIFTEFDNNSDGKVDRVEFLHRWESEHLGDLQHAITLFHRMDTDKDGSISRVPDYSRLFYYFDRDGDNKISESEFIRVWYSLST